MSDVPGHRGNKRGKNLVESNLIDSFSLTFHENVYVYVPFILSRVMDALERSSGTQ